MQEPSVAFREAMRLLGQDPLPDDAESRLEQLELQIRTDEAERFGDLWEAFLAAAPAETSTRKLRGAA